MPGSLPTGVPSVDSLLKPLREGWIVDFTGSGRGWRLLLHHAVARLSGEGVVGVALVHDFGGLDPFLVRGLARLHGGSPGRVLVSRAFRLGDVPGLLGSAHSSGADYLVVVTPFHFAPRSPRWYHRLTPLVAALRRAAGSFRLTLVFNGPSRFSRSLRPEGGSFYRHSVHVSAAISDVGRGVVARLLKHPARREGATLAPWAELGGGWRWVGRRQLAEWL